MYLFVSVFSQCGLLALFDGSEVVASQRFAAGGRNADSIVVSFDALLASSGISDTDLTGIMCVSGPGYFTALRNGVMFANTLAFALRIPIVPISSLEYLSLLCGDSGAVCIPAGSMDYFVLQEDGAACIPREQYSTEMTLCALTPLKTCLVLLLAARLRL